MWLRVGSASSESAHPVTWGSEPIATRGTVALSEYGLSQPLVAADGKYIVSRSLTYFMSDSNTD